MGDRGAISLNFDLAPSGTCAGPVPGVRLHSVGSAWMQVSAELVTSTGDFPIYGDEVCC